MPKWSKKSPRNAENALFRAEMRFCANNGFGAKRSEFSEEVQKSEKRVPKHLKKHWFYKGLSDGAGNVFPETENALFRKNAISRQKANSRNVAHFSQKVLNIGFGASEIVCTL